MADDLLVSCLCVTRDRVRMLSRAISCFLNQSYQPRELIVVYEEDDPATRDFLVNLDQPLIRPVEVAISPKRSLGALRNISIASSRGHYVAQWDDDDWYGANRLSEQIRAIRGSIGGRGCLLSRWIMYDELTQTAYVSERRAWEGSILAERSVMPSYPDLNRGEDTSVIDKMISERNLVSLDRPQLYIYIHHGANTWERTHWLKNILPFAKPLSPENQERVRSILQRQPGTCGD